MESVLNAVKDLTLTLRPLNASKLTLTVMAITNKLELARVVIQDSPNQMENVFTQLPAQAPQVKIVLSEQSGSINLVCLLVTFAAAGIWRPIVLLATWAINWSKELALSSID